MYINLREEKKIKFNIGDKVTYLPTEECGIVKSISDADHVFVVYHCAQEWYNYKDYTAARTKIKDLIMGWQE
jgi:hypothetical protein